MKKSISFAADIYKMKKICKKMKIKHFFLIAIMLVCGSLNAQDHYVNPGNYEDNMVVWAKVYIDGQEQQSNNVIEIGAFNGEAVTASSYVQYYNNKYYLVSLTIGGNSDDNYNVTFKLFDHQNSQEMLYYTISNSNGDPVDAIAWAGGTMLGKPKTPYVLNFQHTNTLHVNAYTEKGNWYLISSPLATSVAPTAVENMIPANPAEQGYDLFYFDQNETKEWQTYKAGGAHAGFDLVPGKGYLYANSQNVDLVFAGAPYTESSLNVTITNAGEGHNSAGWNLIGNPYASAATVTESNYYVMNEYGTDFVAASGNVPAMNGILVYTSETKTVTFAPATGKEEDDSEMITLNLNRENGDLLDRLVVRMGEGGTLPKYVLNANNAHISAVMNGAEYAVVNGTNAFMIPVNFNADKMGRFTLGIDVKRAAMDYLHLIDKLTGDDIDLLLEGSYTFAGTTSDMNDRFILRLRYSGYDGIEEIFAYQSGSDIVVTGEGTLQVFDVMGRYLSSHEINGVQTIEALPMGVYILRMVGDGIKTQKIVVR